MSKEGNKGGQVTIFIILAIIIVAGALLVYSFFPQIKTGLGTEEQNPPSYIQSCIESDVKNAVDKVSVQGGSINPENYLLYKNIPIEYLCYTTEYYGPCLVQQPMLKSHIESEIKKEIDDEVNSCFNSLVKSYENKGYSVELKEGNKNIKLIPRKVKATFNYSLTLTKGNDIQKYDSFIVLLNNNLYELTAIANSIIDWESTYGDAEVTSYMSYYHNLKVEKVNRGDSGRFYIVTDRDTENKFQFAIRGQIWPSGYATSMIQ